MGPYDLHNGKCQLRELGIVVIHPEFLRETQSDDPELQSIKTIGRIYADQLLREGLNCADIESMKIHDLGDDLRSVFTWPRTEAKIVALARFLIENFEEGYLRPIWRERWSELNRFHQLRVLAPLAAGYENVRAGAQLGGLKSARTRQHSATDVEAVVRAATQAGWPEVTKGINKIVSKSFGVGPQRIGQILRAKLSEK